MGSCSLLRGSSQPRDHTQVSHVAGSLSSELPGKPKKTGVGDLSLLQGILLTQGSNQGLLHCRQILYQLSYQVYIKQVIHTSLCIRNCPCTPLLVWSRIYLTTFLWQTTVYFSCFSGYSCTHAFVKVHALTRCNICSKSARNHLLRISILCLAENEKWLSLKNKGDIWSKVDVWKIISKELSISLNATENTDPVSVMSFPRPHLYWSLWNL